MDRDISVRISRIKDGDGQPIEPKEMEFVVRPISYVQARSLLYDSWLESNREAVEVIHTIALYMHHGRNRSSCYAIRIATAMQKSSVSR